MISDHGVEYAGLTINAAAPKEGEDVSYDVVLDGEFKELGALFGSVMSVSESLPHIVSIGLVNFLSNAGYISDTEKEILVEEVCDNSFDGVLDIIREAYHG